MYTPSLRVKNNGVPILSKAEIDAIGERFVRDFQPEVLTNPSPVDIEGFIEFYLGMTPDYQYLSHNGVYLGMTVFNDTNKVPVFDPATNRAEYIVPRPVPSSSTTAFWMRANDIVTASRSDMRVGMTSSIPAISRITPTRYPFLTMSSSPP